MEMIACTCGGLPSHDHLMGGHVQHADGSFGPRWDYDDIGHVWVDWKAVARALMKDEHDRH